MAKMRNDDLLLVADGQSVVLRVVPGPVTTNDEPAAYLLECLFEAIGLPDFSLRRAGFLDRGPLRTGDPAFDQVFVLKGDAAALRRFGMEARKAAAQLPRPTRITSEAGVLSVAEWAGDVAQAERFIKRSLAFCVALSFDSWAALGTAGLAEVEPDCWRGGPVEVAIVRGPRTRVIIRGGFPLSCVLADAPPLRGRIETLNPVADQLVQVAGDPDIVRPLLADEDFLGALLELVHGNPGSTLYPQALSLVVRGVSEEPLKLLAFAESLATRLEGP
jgi:hypothetical protein